MKKLSKIKLVSLSKREMSDKDKQNLRGGSCTDYSCQCNLPSQITHVIDGYLDNQAHKGYIP